jgi:sugar phosphate isomerase/epimerase
MMQLGIAPLCAITATPAEYVRAAERAGFDFVGIRLSPVTDADTRYTPGGRDFRELAKLMADSALEVLDIEVFRMGPHTSPDDWLPLLEMSAVLGARLFNVVGGDTDLGRLSENVGRLTADAASHGVTPVLEPIAYLPLDSYPRAVQIALAAGCAVELDGLHAIRTGMDPALVAEHPELFPIFQLCDAPAVLRSWAGARPAQAGPDDNDMIIESRLNRLLPGTGDSPLRELLAALAPDTPVSVEIPNLELQARYRVDEYIALLHEHSLAYLSA